MRIKSIASGSSGNSIFIGSEETHLLVDAGISGKRIEEGLKQLDLCGKELNGILITHEHSDHISGLGVVSRKFGVPIFATKGTIAAIQSTTAGAKIDPFLFQEITYDQSFSVGDITVRPIRISHDAAQPAAFRFSYGKKSVAVMTDVGYYDSYIVENLRNLDAIFLEANHDVRMLRLGRYTYALKQRILGKRGHLSNETSGRLLSEILHDNMKYVVLSHLSHENNLPELAYESVRMEVTMSDNQYRGEDFDIRVARRDKPTANMML